jgi:hypothetical protein
VRRVAPFAATLILLLASTTVPVAASDWPARFVETFNSACVPQRLSYEGTVAQAKAEGWAEFQPADHSEFGAVMAKSDAAAKEEAEELEMSFRSSTFARDVDERPLHLVVSFMESEYLDAVGCYLYDFEATEPVPASAVSNILGIKPAQSHRDDTMTSYVWGPPPSMPRTLDTYMTFLPKGSPFAEFAGFDGVVLKFTTSAPDGEGEQ